MDHKKNSNVLCYFFSNLVLKISGGLSRKRSNRPSRDLKKARQLSNKSNSLSYIKNDSNYFFMYFELVARSASLPVGQKRKLCETFLKYS